MRRYLPFLIVALVAAITLTAGIWLYRAHRPAALQLAAGDIPRAEDGGETLHALGPANAPVILEEFGDFQCPPCGKLAGPMEEIAKEFRTKLRVIFRELPLPLHGHAREAACAAEAAGLQGKFWQMHGLLYREQAEWSKVPDVRPLLSTYAGTIGLDVSRFVKDLDNEAVKARLAADKERAVAVGASVTPTVFVNGKQVTGAGLTASGLRTAVQEALTATPLKPKA